VQERNRLKAILEVVESEKVRTFQRNCLCVSDSQMTDCNAFSDRSSFCFCFCFFLFFFCFFFFFFFFFSFFGETVL
jgi:hypothetical protein